jgi:RNA polymerase sigma-70 factor, ECF subfamily
LPEGYKQVLSLYVLENKSHKEIADKLNISESTSRSQLLRAKNYLKNSVLNSTYERG